MAKKKTPKKGKSVGCFFVPFLFVFGGLLPLGTWHLPQHQAAIGYARNGQSKRVSAPGGKARDQLNAL
jgi:hypothetical protein